MCTRDRNSRALASAAFELSGRVDLRAPHLSISKKALIILMRGKPRPQNRRVDVALKEQHHCQQPPKGKYDCHAVIDIPVVQKAITNTMGVFIPDVGN